MGKGGAQLGKPVKGKSKERKKDRKAKTGGDAGLADDIKLLEEYERLNKLADAQRLRLKRLQQQEMYNTKINQNILLNVHRKAMRAEKLDSLRKEIEILAQNFEREVDRKDAILQMLTKDIAQAEEQYDTARRTHLIKVQQFITLHEQKLQVCSDVKQQNKSISAVQTSEMHQCCCLLCYNLYFFTSQNCLLKNNALVLHNSQSIMVARILSFSYLSHLLCSAMFCFVLLCFPGRERGL